MLGRRVRFVEATAAKVDPFARKVSLTGGDIAGDIKYDFLLYTLGRRLATERVPGFFEHAHHLLSVKAALRFGEAVRTFGGGHAVVGTAPPQAGRPGANHRRQSRLSGRASRRLRTRRRRPPRARSTSHRDALRLPHH
jgi:hypothetical protein